jgi:hypothetical protein
LLLSLVGESQEDEFRDGLVSLMHISVNLKKDKVFISPEEKSKQYHSAAAISERHFLYTKGK